jgi:dCTP deaminase
MANLNEKFSALSDKRILEYMKEDRVVITPFNKKNLNTSSYDVTLGDYYYREQRPEPGRAIYSPWSESDVRRIWGEPQKAMKVAHYMKSLGITSLGGINKNDYIIPIAPGETILSHTNEYIGGKDGITTMMKARSSMGRNFIEVCKCAGWGDVGYTNRWTMEITNNSRDFAIPLVVGRRIAQIVFFEVGEILSKDYVNEGKYQTDTDIEKLKKQWVPESMLPKMWKDREVSTKLSG